MATSLEPYRDYSEHDVINLFSLEVASNATLSGWKPGAGGDFDAGVIVAVSNGELPGDLPGFAPSATGTGNAALRNYLGASNQPHVGFNSYPVVETTVEVADSDSTSGSEIKTNNAIGITLRQTLAYDENDENLLRYPLKKDELQAVLPGQAVPILTRGLVLLNSKAIVGSVTVGTSLAVGTDAGSVKSAGKFIPASGTAKVVGEVIAVGPTVDSSANDRGVYLCRISF